MKESYKEWKHSKNRALNGKPTETGNRKIARRLAKHKMGVAGFQHINKQMSKKDGKNEKLWMVVLKDHKIPLRNLKKEKKAKKAEAGV